MEENFPLLRKYSKISHGTPVLPGQHKWPWIVRLLFYGKRGNRYTCGGVIISRHALMTGMWNTLLIKKLINLLINI